MQRIPKLRGLQEPVPGRVHPVNLDAIVALGVDEVTLETLVDSGLPARKPWSRCSAAET